MTKVEVERKESGAEQFVNEILAQNSRDDLHKILEFARERLSEELAFFWTRASYFSAVIAALIAGITAVFSTVDNDTDSDVLNVVVFTLSLIGVFISCCWYFANVGGKFWYERWERLADAIEVKVYGTEVYMSKHGGLKSCSPLAGKRRSVTRVAVLLSLAMILVFAVIGMFPMCYLLKNFVFECVSKEALFSVFLMFVLTGACFFFVDFCSKQED